MPEYTPVFTPEREPRMYCGEPFRIAADQHGHLWVRAEAVWGMLGYEGRNTMNQHLREIRNNLSGVNVAECEFDYGHFRMTSKVISGDALVWLMHYLSTRYAALERRDKMEDLVEWYDSL